MTAKSESKGALVYVECPVAFHPSSTSRSVFLGGGISNCPDWQTELVELLEKRGRCPGLVLFNPRRSSFDVADTKASEFQIAWEHRHLALASAATFWFPCETLCPITLYELGYWSAHPSRKPLFVGTHSKYARALDVRVQTALARPELRVGDSVEQLAAGIELWFNRADAAAAAAVTSTTTQAGAAAAESKSSSGASAGSGQAAGGSATGDVRSADKSLDAAGVTTGS